MTVTIDDLSPVERTLLITLTGRALDTGQERPLLGDRMAAEVLDRMDLDANPVQLGGTVRIATAIRSKMLDRIVAAFVAAHPNAVVVELACSPTTSSPAANWPWSPIHA